MALERTSLLSFLTALLVFAATGCTPVSYWDDDDRYWGRRYDYRDRHYAPNYRSYSYPQYRTDREEWQRRRDRLHRQERQLAEQRARLERERREFRRERERVAKRQRETQRRAERRETE
jgi:hypothetical protein